VGALVVYGSSMLAAQRMRIADFAVKNGAPAFTVARE